MLRSTRFILKFYYAVRLLTLLHSAELTVVLLDPLVNSYYSCLVTVADIVYELVD